MVFFLIEKEKIKEYNVNVLGGEPKNILKRRKYKMKKMIKKVIVAVLAMAMALGMMTVATSAATPTNKTVYLVVDDEDTSKYAMNFWNGVSTDAVTANIGWGDTNLKPVFTKVQDGLLKMEVTVWSDIKPQGENGIQIVSFETVGSNTGEYKACSENGKNTYWSDVYNAFAGTETEIWLALDSWTIKTTTPVAITKTPAEIATEAIAAIGTVALTDECDAKIKAAKNAIDACGSDTSGITNLSTYTAAKARWDELVEDGAGELKIHVKYDWAAAAVYTYGVNDGEAHAAGAWPGTVPTANANNDGWKDVTVTTESAVNVIVNNNGNGEQAETKYVSAGEYWITVSSTPNGADLSISPDAPDGWSTGVVTPPPTGDNDDDTTTPSSPAGDKDDESAGDGEEGGSSAEDTPAGDNSMVAIYAILAVLAAGVVTVAVAKRRAIEE